jgi:tetratricopeptide (TPR) repeat protein
MLGLLNKPIVTGASMNLFKSAVVVCVVVAMCGCDRSQPTAPVATNAPPPATESSGLLDGVDGSRGNVTGLVDAAFRGLDASPVPMPKRPASKLKAVPQNEAWKTPLKLARFHADQFQGKARARLLTGTATALVRGGEFEKATELALLLSGADVDSVLLQVVRNGSDKGDSVDPNWLLKVARWIKDPARRARATIEVAKTLAKSGDQEGALEAIRESRVLVKEEPGIGVLSEIAMAQLAVGKKQEALAATELALSLIRAEKVDLFYGRSYQRIGRVFVRAGELQKVKRLTGAENSLWDKTVSGSLRVDLAVMMAEEGELTAALEWIGQFPDGDTTEQQNKQKAYGNIAIGLAEKGDLKQAMQVMSLAERQLSFSFRTASMKGDMAIAMATAGKIQEAMNLSRLRGVGSKEVLLAISAAQWDAGQMAAARETLARAEEAGEGVAGFFSQEHQTLQTMAIAYAKTGQKELAVEKIKAAVEAANDYDENRYTTRSEEDVVAERLLDMLPALVLAGDQKQTEETIQRAVTMAKKVSSLKMAATNLVEAELYQQALEVAGMIEKPENKRSAIREMALSLTRLSDPDDYRRFGPGDTEPLKNEFTTEEQAFAKQLVTAMSIMPVVFIETRSPDSPSD